MLWLEVDQTHFPATRISVLWLESPSQVVLAQLVAVVVHGWLYTGMKAGMKVGMNAGMKAGMNAGMKAGMNAGMKVGMNAGMKAGMNAGMKAGMNAGMTYA